MIKNWRWEGLDRLGKMGNNRKMFSSKIIIQKIDDTTRARFQYILVRSLVLALLREGNIFRPRTAFEELLAVQEKKKSLKNV